MRLSHFPMQEILEYQGNMRILPFEKPIRNNFLSYMIIIIIAVTCIYQNHIAPAIERNNSEKIAMWVHNSWHKSTVGKYIVFPTKFFFTE